MIACKILNKFWLDGRLIFFFLFYNYAKYISEFLSDIFLVKRDGVGK